MFELIGIADLSPGRVPVTVPQNVLPAERWNGAVRSRVSRPHLAAVFLEHAPGGQSHSADGHLQMFVVGEPHARARSRGSNNGAAGPLAAHAVLQLFREDPARFQQGLKGNFTLAIVDQLAQRCLLYNSRYGISPFYYARDGSRFIFSTSLSAVGACLGARPELDLAAVAELAVFGYPLSDRTYFTNVSMLRPAEIVCARAGVSHTQIWWDVRQLYDASPYRTRDAIEIGSELLHDTANQLVSDVPRARLSFTSGFDSRAILAVLERRPEKFLGYSFGIPGSVNVSIPQQICKQLGLAFEPIYLDEEYERSFDEYALACLLLTDCLSTVERANYPYAFEKLADFSPVVLTGLFGSELMRTFQNVGYIVSAKLARVALAADPRAEFRRIVAEPGATGYFAAELLGSAVPEIEADLRKVVLDPFGNMSPDHRFYMFLLSEGLRKYFGAELHMERPWGINRFPFLDDEFVEFAFRAPFAGVHSRTLKPTVQNRFRSQYFYASAIQKYWPELLLETTDHGYAPRDLLSPLALCRIGPKLLVWNQKKKRMKYREFKTEEWTRALYRRHLFRRTADRALFSERLEQEHRSGAWQVNHLEFAKAASFKLWLEMLEGIAGVELVAAGGTR